MPLVQTLADRMVLSQDAYNLEDSLVTLHTLESVSGEETSLLRRFEYEGTGDAAAICDELKKIFGDPTLMQEEVSDKSYYNEYSDPQSYVRIYFNANKDNHVQVRGVTTNPSVYERIKALNVLIVTKKPSNSVFALMSSSNGLALRSIGNINHNIIEDNYTKDAITGYKHIVNCLSSGDPCGRLALLQGPPGTGKSYMIRSLVSNVRSTFVVVGSHMIADLAGPAILPVIMGCVNEDDKKPITFILEDSDLALSHRKNGGVAELSGLLNLGDGLLGEMLDIRIIATTNAETLDLDPAVVRPGRMCQRLMLKALPSKEATALYANMVKDTKETKAVFKNETTLAEIYRMAREDGWRPVVEDEPSNGQYL